jgi:hypothetical protein
VQALLFDGLSYMKAWTRLNTQSHVSMQSCSTEVSSKDLRVLQKSLRQTANVIKQQRKQQQDLAA